MDFGCEKPLAWLVGVRCLYTSSLFCTFMYFLTTFDFKVFAFSMLRCSKLLVFLTILWHYLSISMILLYAAESRKIPPFIRANSRTKRFFCFITVTFWYSSLSSWSWRAGEEAATVDYTKYRMQHLGIEYLC